MPWAALCPFAGKFQRAKLPMPTFPLQGTGSLVPFLQWAASRAQLADASPACAPFQRGMAPAEQHPTPFCCSFQQCCQLLHGLDHLTAQGDPARPAGDTLSNSGRAVLESLGARGSAEQGTWPHILTTSSHSAVPNWLPMPQIPALEPHPQLVPGFGGSPTTPSHGQWVEGAWPVNGCL